MREIDRLVLIQEARDRGVDYITGQPIRDASEFVTASDDARRDKLGDVVALTSRSVSAEHGHGIRGSRVGMMDAPRPTRGRGKKVAPPTAA